MKDERFIRIVIRILSLFCPPHLLEEIEGDLIERFNSDVQRKRNARLRMAWSAIQYFRPGILLRNRFSKSQTPSGMITHHLTRTFRDLRMNKIFGLLTISGLAIGIMSCLIIGVYVDHELSFDSFHRNADNIYRIHYSRFLDGEFQYKKAQVFPAVGEAILKESTQVVDYVRIFPINTQIETVFSVPVGHETKSFHETSVWSVDSSFLRIFSFPLVHGDSATALSGSNKLLISESTARKYFGDADPINKVITWQGMGDWTVSGVFKDVPPNSHMKFDFLSSWVQVYGERSKWNWDGFYTYVVLKEGSILTDVEANIQKIIDSNTQGSNSPRRVESKFELFPLRAIHLESHLLGEMERNGNKNTVLAILISGCILLLISIVNYTNLSLARIFKRSKEAGIRTVIGSGKGQIVFQYFVESATISFIALGLSLVLLVLLQDFIRQLTDIPEFTPWITSPRVMVILLLAMTGVSYLASVVPSRILTMQNPIRAIQGLTRVARGTHLKRGLLLFQFLATFALIAAALIVHNQISFMNTRDIGFEPERKIVIKTLAAPAAEMDTSYLRRLRVFKENATSIAGVTHVTVSSNIPGRENEWQGRVHVKETDDLVQMYRTRIDEDFFATFKIELLAGTDSTTRDNEVIINRTAARLIGFDNPENALGHKLFAENSIVGVTEDYNEQSLHNAIRPSMYTYGQGYLKFITIDARGNLSSTLLILENSWKQIFPDKPFEFFFLDDYYQKQYARDVSLSNVLYVFSGLSIFVCSLGLFGFSYYIVHQRIREVSIRKVLGASGIQIMRLLTNEFFILIIASSAIAAPLVYIVSERWLSGFAYRMEMQWVYLVWPLAIVLLVSLAVIGLNVARVIRANPSESLKSE